MATETKTFDLSTISNSKGSATYGFTYSGGVLTPANKSKDNTYAYAKLTFEMPGDGTLKLGVTQSSEKSYDFGLVSNLDSSLSYDTSVDSSVKYNAKGLDGSTTITYDNVTKGSHFITVKYKKDGSQSTGSDVFNITSLVATYEAAVEGVTTFDLSTLELEEGTYDITVVAKADGYANSAASAAVSYEVAAEEELVGTWVFNPTASLTGLTADMWGVYSTSSIAQSVYIAEVNHNGNLRKVTCNQALTTGGITGYRGIVLTYSNANSAYNGFSYRSVGSTYSIDTATLPNCSITFYEIVETDDRIVINGDFIAWLKANATKQGATSLITFTIDGTSYQAEEGMTWYEWCHSDYNTYGYSTLNESRSYVTKNIGNSDEYVCKSASGGFSNCVVGNGTIDANATYYHYVQGGGAGD